MATPGGKEATVKQAAPVLLRMVREHQERITARAGDVPGSAVVDGPGDLSGDAA